MAPVPGIIGGKLMFGIDAYPNATEMLVVDTSGNVSTQSIPAGGGSTAWADITGRPTTLAGYGITDAQPLDATLTALAGVTTAADKFIYATAADTFTSGTVTSYARTLLDDADAATAATTLGLGTGSSVRFANVAINAATNASYVLHVGGPAWFDPGGTTGLLIDSYSGGPRLLGFETITFQTNPISGDTLYTFNSGATPVCAFRTVGVDVTGTFNVLGASQITALSSTSATREQGAMVGSWVSSTDASRKAQVEFKVYDTSARTVAREFANGTNGYFALKALTTAPADADLANGEIVFYDNGSGSLAIKLKDSGGTVRTGTVTLT